MKNPNSCNCMIANEIDYFFRFSHLWMYADCRDSSHWMYAFSNLRHHPQWDCRRIHSMYYRNNNTRFICHLTIAIQHDNTILLLPIYIDAISFLLFHFTRYAWFNIEYRISLKEITETKWIYENVNSPYNIWLSYSHYRNVTSVKIRKSLLMDWTELWFLFSLLQRR